MYTIIWHMHTEEVGICIHEVGICFQLSWNICSKLEILQQVAIYTVSLYM